MSPATRTGTAWPSLTDGAVSSNAPAVEKWQDRWFNADREPAPPAHFTARGADVPLAGETDDQPSGDQDWFWASEWQQAEREADEDIRKGDVATFENVEDLIDDLDK